MAKLLFYFNIELMYNNMHTTVYNKRDNFVIPIVNSAWLSGDVHVPRLRSDMWYLQFPTCSSC